MQLPIFTNQQFLDQTTLNTSFQTLNTGIEGLISNSVTSAGLLNTGDLSFSSSGLTLTVTATSSFAVIFSNGVVSNFLGTTAGQTSDSVSLNLSSFVPSTGSQTVYIVATSYVLPLNPTIIYGPPVGDPNYSTAFSPVQAYTTQSYSLNVFATTTAPDNTDTFELCRVSLSSGATTIPPVVTSYQVTAGYSVTYDGVVNALGYVPLASPLTSSDVTTALGYTPLASPLTSSDITTALGYTPVSNAIFGDNNIWTGENTFDGHATFNNIQSSEYYLYFYLAANSFNALAFIGNSSATYTDTIIWRRNNASGHAASIYNSSSSQNLFYVTDAGNATLLGNLSVGGTTSTGSDIALKDDIAPLKWSDKEKLFSLNPVSFTYKSDGVKSMGFVAQEVETLYPEIVHKSESGLLSLNYSALIAPIVAALKDHEKRLRRVESA